MSKRIRKGRSKGSGRALAGARKQELRKTIQGLGPLGDSDEDWPDDLGLEDQYAPATRRPPRPKEPKSPATSPATSPTAEPTPLSEEGKGVHSLGDVVSLASGLCWVRDDSAKDDSASSDSAPVIECILPSRLAADQQASLAVGDRVRIGADEVGIYRVLEVLPRRTTLSRPDPHNPRKQRVIAANIDVVVHVAAAKDPPLRCALIDRYLIAIERSGAEAVICINKVDLLTSEAELKAMREQLEPYAQMGLRLLYCSAQTGEGVAELRRLLLHRTAVFVGHSGVGKSSLLNRLAPGLGQATAEVSNVHGTGRHTTTRSSLHLSGDGIRLIDTPGIRELGLWKLSTAELSAYFPDLEEEAGGCRFKDCSHTHEPDCSVRAADRDGRLHPGRYATYLRIRESLQEGNF